jgi:hypothetical protein
MSEAHRRDQRDPRSWIEPVRIDMVNHAPAYDPECHARMRAFAVAHLDDEWTRNGGNAMRSATATFSMTRSPDRTMGTCSIEDGRRGRKLELTSPIPITQGLPHPNTYLRYVIGLCDATSAPTPDPDIGTWMLGVAALLEETGVEPRSLTLPGPYQPCIAKDGHGRHIVHELLDAVSPLIPRGVIVEAMDDDEDGMSVDMRPVSSIVRRPDFPGSIGIDTSADAIATLRAVDFVRNQLKDAA